ncbi:MAG: hypothetical protein GEV11_26565 [Streptosporangiales bacterium]|nr:hypothetical protein [Streptosporangiales bacterium]
MGGTAGIVLVATGGGAAYAVYSGVNEPAPKASAGPAATEQIRRGDVVQRTTATGTLGYADSFDLTAARSGTVTYVPTEGATVKRGQTLYGVDRTPVTLMYGKVPLYRTLSEGVTDGPDVRQLESNLRALGHGDGLTVDEEFTAATAAAVEAWQEDRGLTETGRVDAAQVVFRPAAVRVADAALQTGERAGPGAKALTLTSTRRIVLVPLDVADQRLAKKGGKVQVELPAGDTVDGVIIEVGTVATAPRSESGSSGAGSDGGATEDPTVDVEVELTDPDDAGGLDQAPVSVHLESERAENVLSVPVGALLALREGGYGVEVAEAGGARIVAVETGLFGDGRVEITGAGLAPGMRVGVPAP